MRKVRTESRKVSGIAANWKGQKMNYRNETIEELERVLDMMTADKNSLISNGFHEVAEQNQEVINAIISELRKRG